MVIIRSKIPFVENLGRSWSVFLPMAKILFSKLSVAVVGFMVVVVLTVGVAFKFERC